MPLPSANASCGVGFVCDISGRQRRDIVTLGIEAVKNLTHRGAVGADGKTGDGAGVLVQIPRDFFVAEAGRLGIAVADALSLAVGMFFLYGDHEDSISGIVKHHGLRPLGWRDVPTDEGALGRTALAGKPRIRQILIDAAAVAPGRREAALYLVRREIEKTAGRTVSIPSLSSRVIAYKGMLVAPHLAEFYPDLRDPGFRSTFCLFHQRFSTNTSPDWTLAQPFRVLAHNGEINTLAANRGWVSLLEQVMEHEVFGGRMDLVRPLTSPDESDSASLDRVMELLVLAGYAPEHAVTLLVPPAWEAMELTEEERAFFEYHSLLMKPWDGPAAVAFSDGVTIGAHMDRNGLRPLRYTWTADGLFVLGSETGMIDLGSRAIKEKGRLGPGETVAIDLASGRVRFTPEIVRDLASRRPYREWLAANLVAHKPAVGAAPAPTGDKDLLRAQIAFGYTAEEIQASLKIMAATGREPVYSMGDDTPLPPLAARPQLLFRYFKQRFSQVTNPPIDPIREKMVMSLRMNLGPKQNVLSIGPEHSRRYRIDSPVLSGRDVREIEAQTIFPVSRVAITYAKAGMSLEAALRSLREQALAAVGQGAEILVLGDRDLSPERIAIPSLLALSAVYTMLQRERVTSRVSVIVETGEARDVHHIACLIGYGASAVHPWLAFDTTAELCRKEEVPGPCEAARSRFRSALESGLLKVTARMGIATVNSYHAGRLFDAVCLNRDFVEEFFDGTAVTVEADGMPEIENALLFRHAAAFGPDAPVLDQGGDLRYRKEGEIHAWSPPVVAALNRFIRTRGESAYREFSSLANARPVFIRHLLGYATGNPVPIESVEPEETILERFVAGAMSVGALSPEAHETIAEACNRLGIKSNSGEGGEESERYFTPRSSAMKQVASGRFGVTPAYLASAADLEIKISQGAKPGEGGHLPAEKVTAYVAALRHSAAGRVLISPPPHHDIYSIEDLAQLIHDLKQANPLARVCVKLVAESGVGTVAAGAAKAYADIIQISGCEGGTGAAAISSIKNAGSYWETGLAETQRVLVANGLRGRVRLRVDGGLRTGRDVVIAALLGAEEFGFGTAAMIAAGCVMARQCHANTCPTGIATQDQGLRKRFRGTVDGIMSYFRALAHEVRAILSGMGAAGLDEIIGRTDLLVPSPPDDPPGARRVGLSIFCTPPAEGPRFCVVKRNDNPAPSLNDRLVRDLLPFIEGRRSVEREYAIRNIDRSIPVRLNYYIARLHRDEGLPPDTLRLLFRGTAGQSFGAFNHRGLSLTLIGDANDYAGKGMYGGRIAIIHADVGEPHKHVIVGNTVLYGATGGEFYAAGMAGERFGVRNSGAFAVVEGAGLHLGEYMTGGVIAVLGETGANIGAGMTGGVIYLPDRGGRLSRKINGESVGIAGLDDGDAATLRTLLESHRTFTGSGQAAALLADFERESAVFRKIVPRR